MEFHLDYYLTPILLHLPFQHQHSAYSIKPVALWQLQGDQHQYAPEVLTVQVRAGQARPTP